MRVRTRPLVFIGITGLILVLSGFEPMAVVFLLLTTFVLLRFATGPLSVLIARIGYSIRWKFEIAITVMALLFLSVGLISFSSMDFMHAELHEIIDIGPDRSFEVLQAVDSLEDTQHSALFTMVPFLGVLGVLAAATLGSAMALSVITPVRRMGEKMGRIGSGDFTEAVEVENVDELGELADGLNETSRELARLQEATVAAERERGLQERITQVTLAQEEERRRISRELHDGLGPSLAAIGNRIRSCQSTVRTDPEASERELGEVANSLKVHIQEIRQLVYGLRPLALDQLGLIGALKQHVESFGQETGLETSFGASGEVALDSLGEVTILRVMQECLNNAQKHAEASRVDVRLRVVEAGLELTVEDDGRGFGPSGPDSKQQGIGLMSMRERADLLRGSLTVEESPSGGGMVVLSIPLEEHEVGAH